MNQLGTTRSVYDVMVISNRQFKVKIINQNFEEEENDSYPAKNTGRRARCAKNREFINATCLPLYRKL